MNNHYFILSINDMLDNIEIIIIPKNKTAIETLFFTVIFPALNNTYPASKLKHAHITLTRGVDSPLPGGLAKGVGKGSPEMP